MGDIADNKATPFILVKVKKEFGTYQVLTAGEGITYEKVCRRLDGSEDSSDISLAGEGKLKHFSGEKKIIIYSSPGPSHKLTFSLLKEAFPDYSSIIWRDG